MDTKLYSDFYKDYYNRIESWVTRAGIPPQEVPDVSSSIVLTILEKDGISKYDSSKNVKMSTYLNKYVFLTARSYHQKLLNPDVRVDPYPEVPDRFSSETNSSHDLFDRLYSILDGDALEFLIHASESQDYTQARKCLSDQGWEKKRITAAVLAVRKATKGLLSE